MKRNSILVVVVLLISAMLLGCGKKDKPQSSTGTTGGMEEMMNQAGQMAQQAKDEFQVQAAEVAGKTETQLKKMAKDYQMQIIEMANKEMQLTSRLESATGSTVDEIKSKLAKVKESLEKLNEELKTTISALLKMGADISDLDLKEAARPAQ